MRFDQERLEDSFVCFDLPLKFGVFYRTKAWLARIWNQFTLGAPARLIKTSSHFGKDADMPILKQAKAEYG